MYVQPEPLHVAPHEPAGNTTLGVVMPAYNEGTWVLRAVEALLVAVERAGWTASVTVVDDGSTDPASLAALARVGELPGVRVLNQENAGRFAARARGIRETDTDLVLLLDARVEVEPESLLHARKGLSHGATVWNYDVTPASRDLGALFWTGITKVWWRDYFRNRAPVSFGIEDFDRYPKGTGAFLAPTDLLRSAIGDFDSHFADAALASDDTRLLRNIARMSDINLSPAVMCRHHAKSGRGAWVRQCYYRGTTFVDGYLRDADRAGHLLAGVAAAAAAAATLAVQAPRTTAAGTLAACASAGALTRWSGGSTREAVAVGALSPAFGMCFGVGVVRGLRLAAVTRLSGPGSAPAEDGTGASRSRTSGWC